MTVPFRAADIQSHWQALDWSVLQPPDETSLRYVRYYGLDFRDRRPELEHGFGYFRTAQHAIAAHAWRPPDPRGTVFVCHGYFDHVGLYRHVIGHVLDAGYAVIAYDLPGHGLSSGPRAEIDDFATYQSVLEACLSHARGHFPAPWHVIAQSTGGGIVMDYLLRHGFTATTSPFRQVILLAPLVRPSRWYLARWVHTLLSPFVPSIRRVFTANSSDPDFLDFLERRDPLQPRRLPASWVGALKRWLPELRRLPPIELSPVVIQGDQDETVDWRYGLRVIGDKFRDPEVHIIAGAGHHLANERSDYRARIFAIVDEVLKRP